MFSGQPASLAPRTASQRHWKPLLSMNVRSDSSIRTGVRVWSSSATLAETQVTDYLR
jgi:hypothetical protein